MGGICLPPKVVDAFKSALTSGKIIPEKLAAMTSEERHALFKDIVGEGNAKFVNSTFEAKMLLKNQQQGYLTWAKKLTGVTPEVRRDLISRISKMDKVLNPVEEKAFLKDLASTRLGTDVTAKEAKQITDMSSKLQESMSAVQESIKAKGFAGTPLELRLKAGVDRVEFQNYLDGLKAAAKKESVGQIANPANWFKNVKTLMGTVKGLVASFTSHAPLKHGFFALFEDPAHWAKNYVTQFSDAARQVAGKDMMSAIKASGYARENSLNGIYDKWIPGELTKTNEEFHAGIPEKIPVFNRFYKGSKVMFDGFVLKTRMDLVDHYVNIVRKMGLDPLDAETAKAWGQLAIDQSGGKTTNPDGLMSQFLFSQRLLKSQVNNLTLHMFDKTATTAVKVQSAKTLAKVVAGLAAVMVTANYLSPGSAEYDPRSSNFGKFKVGDTKFDISGGYSSLVTLAARAAYAVQGKPAIKSSTTGALSNLGTKQGQTSWQTLLGNFLQGRASPSGQIIADLANQQTFAGGKPTVKGEVTNLITPIPVQTYTSLKNDPHAANTLAVMIAQQLSLMSNTSGGTPAGGSSLDKSTSTSMLQFKKSVGTQQFEAASQKYDQAYQTWLGNNKAKFSKMTPAEQQAQIKGEKSHLNRTILKPSGYKTVKGAKTALLNN